jgi:Polysaccharide deacetylase
MVISISMQFEAGGQPSKGTDSPFAYGYREGIPRMLDLWDRHGVKVTSHMIGEAAQHHPELAKEIVARGHDPQMVRVWNAFLHYAKSRPGVAFLRKDEIARFGLQSPLTLRESETI